jgi:hypothetical protein
MADIIPLKRGDALVEGYRKFVAPDEMRRRRLAEERGERATVLPLKADRPEEPAPVPSNNGPAPRAP